MAGALSKKLLAHFKIEVLAYSKAIGKVQLSKAMGFEEIRKHRYEWAARCPDLTCAQAMEETILAAKKEGDSLGGIIECIILNVPPGVGDPMFDALDSDLAKAVFMVPAVKGVEFGAGFSVCHS